MLTTIESRLHDEIYNLKAMIQSLLPRDYYDRHRYQDQSYRNSYQNYNVPNYDQQRYQPQQHENRNYYDNHRNEVQRPQYTTAETPTTRQAQTVATETSTRENIFTTPSQVRAPEVMNVMKKSLETNRIRTSKTPVTQATTPETHATTNQPPMKNEYVYYWKLENFPKVFIHAKKNEVFSHVFNVKGLFLRIRAVMNDLASDNLVVDIEHLANVENSEKMEIEISDGFVFQEIAEEKLFQFSFAIMDQTKPDHDLISPIYWNTDTDNFVVPNSVYLLANYVKNDSLLIKLVISF